jgi:hypothetical protein
LNKLFLFWLTEAGETEAEEEAEEAEEETEEEEEADEKEETIKAIDRFAN